MGTAAGYPEFALMEGAAYAEIHDSAHDPHSPYYKGPYDGKTELFQTPWGEFQNEGDNPNDAWAVAFGIALYRTWGAGLSFESFQFELNLAFAGFATHMPNPDEVQPDVKQAYQHFTYPVGFFDPTKGGV